MTARGIEKKRYQQLGTRVQSETKQNLTFGAGQAATYTQFVVGIASGTTNLSALAVRRTGLRI